jgi:AAA+ superfamily predicted ATPase
VGKTSTAECIAEHTKKPLFSITCGDIGDTAESVERNLDRYFQIANRWGCVLLLDEANVFMAKRGKTDLQRNALVSVFLRVLEYYSGILFLTTNRIGIFDKAFKSRIHMSLGYPPLDEKSTKKIWIMNIERTMAHFGDKLLIDKVDIMDFAMKHFRKTVDHGDYASAWNGRQIRNGAFYFSELKVRIIC